MINILIIHFARDVCRLRPDRPQQGTYIPIKLGSINHSTVIVLYFSKLDYEIYIRRYMELTFSWKCSFGVKFPKKTEFRDKNFEVRSNLRNKL